MEQHDPVLTRKTVPEINPGLFTPLVHRVLHIFHFHETHTTTEQLPGCFAGLDVRYLGSHPLEQ